MNKLILPIAIVLAGLAVAFSVYYTGTHSAPTPKKVDESKILGNENVTPVSEYDHIRGSKDAKLVIVEYSDTECPFCKRYHAALKQVFDEYSANNKVAWVYRSFPLDEIHTKAHKEAEALECASELGGNDIFWKYVDEVYDKTPSNDGLELSQLAVFADDVGLDKTAFQKCLDSNKYAAKVKEAKETALKTGALATPYTAFVLKTKDKEQIIPLVNLNGESLGALPYDQLKSVVEKLINS